MPPQSEIRISFFLSLCPKTRKKSRFESGWRPRLLLVQLLSSPNNPGNRPAFLSPNGPLLRQRQFVLSVGHRDGGLRLSQDANFFHNDRRQRSIPTVLTTADVRDF